MEITTIREILANQKKNLELEDKDFSDKEVTAILQGLEDIKNGNTTPIHNINNIWADIL